MARYFLHLRDGSDELLDPDGVELADMAAVEKSALAAARDVIAGDVCQGTVDLGYRIDAETASGDIVYTIAFQDAVTVKRLRHVA